jgi:hypothetical protein
MALAERFHVTIAGVRTTVSLDKTLSALLSLALTDRRDHQVVRDWCQKQIDRDPGAFEARVSQYLQRLAVLEIAAPHVQDAFWRTEDERIRAHAAKNRAAVEAQAQPRRRRKRS